MTDSYVEELLTTDRLTEFVDTSGHACDVKTEPTDWSKLNIDPLCHPCKYVQPDPNEQQDSNFLTLNVGNSEVNPTPAAQNSTNCHKCEMCSEQFSELSMLSRHKCTHSAEKPHVGFVHDKDATTLGVNNSIQQPQACNVSAKAYSDSAVHTGKSRHVCELCKRAFNQLPALRRHRAIHTGIKPYICDVCNQAFRHLSSLKRHKVVHTDDKPHVCHVCKKMFKQAFHLKLHIRTHTGEKPHTCGVCEKSFNVPSSLTRHKSTHTGVKSHVCGMCETAFNNSSNLRRHILSHSRQKNKL